MYKHKVYDGIYAHIYTVAHTHPHTHIGFCNLLKLLSISLLAVGGIMGGWTDGGGRETDSLPDGTYNAKTFFTSPPFFSYIRCDIIFSHI